jgi:tRNA threonylcarbamoyladenosine biosynthesis protein TsaB
MIILSVRTDKPKAEISLFDDTKLIGHASWEAHRQLAETIHAQLRELLTKQKKTWSDVEGVIIYKGPGSFTGLRIGMSVANALASSLKVPIVSMTGADWQEHSIREIMNGKNEKIVTPEYGSSPHITQQKK